jgi:hypothetical protein
MSKYPRGTRNCLDLLPQSKGFESFLDLAAAYNLKSCVNLKVTQQRTTKSLTASLLRSVLPYENCSVKSGLPLPSVEIVSFLLDSGGGSESTVRSSKCLGEYSPLCGKHQRPTRIQWRISSCRSYRWARISKYEGLAVQ